MVKNGGYREGGCRPADGLDSRPSILEENIWTTTWRKNSARKRSVWKTVHRNAGNEELTESNKKIQRKSPMDLTN